jgi:hypothetical protein
MKRGIKNGGGRDFFRHAKERPGLKTGLGAFHLVAEI